MTRATAFQVCWTALTEPGGLVEVLRVNQGGAAVPGAVPWVQVRHVLEYKQTWRWGEVIAVPPRYTSQECPKCHWPEEGDRP